MDILIDSGAEKIIERIEKAGFQAYITGSAIRDSFMGRPVAAVHISTSAKPDAVAQIFNQCINIDRTTETVTVAENKTGYEISTFKSTTSLCGRKPDVYDDLSAHGFTIDAVAFNPCEGILDFFGGIADIKKGIIKSVVEPDEYFRKYPDEMLRAVRLCVTLNFNLDENTERSIRKYSVCSKHIAHEVILEEFNKILMSKLPDRGFRMLHELGLLMFLMPQLDKCFSVPQKNKYHIYNVGEHILHALSSSPEDFVLRWAALLHDVGKPSCMSRDNNGIIHFYGHHRESMKIAENILNNLRIDSESAHEIIVLIEYHDVRIEQSLPAIKRIMSRIGENLFQKLLILQETDCKAKNPLYIPEKLEKTKRLRDLFRTVIEEAQPYKISDLAINSRDLMKLKYKAGREIADTLKTLLEDIILNPSLNNRDYLLKRAKSLRNR